MMLREFYKLWSETGHRALKRDMPGPFLLINWPFEENPWARRLLRLDRKVSESGEVLVGRAQGSGVTVAEAGVSNRHIILRPGREGSWLIVDLHATNGTHINQHRLAPGQPLELGSDQTIVLGTRAQVRFLEFDALAQLVATIRGDSTPDPVPLLDPKKANETLKLEGAAFQGLFPPRGGDTDGGGPRLTRRVRSLPPTLPKVDRHAAKFNILCEGLEPFQIAEGETCVIGRHEDVDLRLAHAQVSRRHATLTVERGQLFLEDLGSANGTIVGRKEIFGKKVALREGTTIRVPPFRLMIQRDMDAVASETGRFSDSDVLLQSKRAGKDVILSGALAKISATEVLQGIEFNQKTGTIFITDDKIQGFIVFESGRVGYAEAHSTKGPIYGEDAFFVMLGLPGGRFNVVKEVDPYKPNLQRGISALLMEYARKVDEGG